MSTSPSVELKVLANHVTIILLINYRHIKQIEDSATHGWKYLIVDSTYKKSVRFAHDEHTAMDYISKHKNVIKINHPITIPIETEYWNVTVWTKRTKRTSYGKYVVMFSRK